MYNQTLSANHIYLYPTLLSILSFILFFYLGHTAYEWPAIDMVPFYERYLDPNFAINDFFTNAISSERNPRWIFGISILVISELFSSSWYTVLYILKLTFVLFLPVLFYYVLSIGALKYSNITYRTQIQFLSFIFVLLSFSTFFSTFLTIASWEPLFIQATSSTLSLFLGLVGILIKELDSRYARIFSIFIFALATLEHPAVGIFVILFDIIINIAFLKNNLYYYAQLFVYSIILPIVILKIFFASNTNLSTIDFLKIYVFERHPHHYALKYFFAMPRSYYTLGFYFVLMILPLFYFFKKKNEKKVLFFSIVLFTLTIVVFISQYFFVYIFPNKMIIELGPVRFSQFFYWLCAILWIIILSKQKLFRNISSIKFQFFYIFIVSIVTLYILGIFLLDNYRQDCIKEPDQEVLDFVKTTKQDSVFYSPNNTLNINIRNFTGRSLYITHEFPFNENFFIEFSRRRSEVVNAKNLQDFVRVSNEKRLDYLVVDIHSFESSTCPTVFMNNLYKIYDLNKLRSHVCIL